MQKLTLTGVLAALALTLAGSASPAPKALTRAAPLLVGVNDQAGLDSGLAGWFFPTMSAQGLQVNAIDLRWDETKPDFVPDVEAVDEALARAAANGITVELGLFPLHSQVFTGGQKCAPSTDPLACGDPQQLAAWAAWVGDVATTFPDIHQYVVMNECNQPLFVNPQWDTSGANQSAEVCGRALASAYDALHTADSHNVVWGLGLSPRGNDNPATTSNSSTSPVAFLTDLGAWFKAFASATGRTAPLMDGLDFHPYAIPQSLPFATGYAVTTAATISNLPRIYQAFYSGFAGTPQPTIGQQAGGGLPVSLNEVGVQTDTAHDPTAATDYTGTEQSGMGVTGQYATEGYQAGWYGQMLDTVACDPNIARVDIFHLVDESALAGWQSGLFYHSPTPLPKLSALTVHDWIAATGGNCIGTLHAWTPAGAPATQEPGGPPPSQERIVVGAAGRLRVLDGETHLLRRVYAPFGAAYSGPLSVALGDANGDGVSDFAVATGRAVRLLNGKNGRTIAQLGRGASVAMADMTGDGRADIVVGSGPGIASSVKVFDGRTHKLIESLSPFAPTFLGGVSVAAADVTGAGRAEVVAGTGPGAPARVAVYLDTKLVASFSPFAPSYAGGVALAATANGVVAGTGPGVKALVRTFTGAKHRLAGSFSPFAPLFTGGISLAAADLSGDGKPDLVIGAGAGGNAQVRVVDGRSRALLGAFLGAPGSGAITVAAG